MAAASMAVAAAMQVVLMAAAGMAAADMAVMAAGMVVTATATELLPSV